MLVDVADVIGLVGVVEEDTVRGCVTALESMIMATLEISKEIDANRAVVRAARLVKRIANLIVV